MYLKEYKSSFFPYLEYKKKWSKTEVRKQQNYVQIITILFQKVKYLDISKYVKYCQLDKAYECFT